MACPSSHSPQRIKNSSVPPLTPQGHRAANNMIAEVLLLRGCVGHSCWAGISGRPLFKAQAAWTGCAGSTLSAPLQSHLRPAKNTAPSGRSAASLEENWAVAQAVGARELQGGRRERGVGTGGCVPQGLCSRSMSSWAWSEPEGLTTTSQEHFSVTWASPLAALGGEWGQ